jgi:hypothetical protein
LLKECYCIFAWNFAFSTSKEIYVDQIKYTNIMTSIIKGILKQQMIFKCVWTYVNRIIKVRFTAELKEVQKVVIIQLECIFLPTFPNTKDFWRDFLVYHIFQAITCTKIFNQWILRNYFGMFVWTCIYQYVNGTAAQENSNRVHKL